MWLVVLLLVAASAIIASLFLYYKKRVATLKTEILAVQYSADPQAYPDRHHFDNPVYAFQGPGPGPSNGGGNTRMNNFVKPNNLQGHGQFQQLMTGGDSSGSSTASGRAGNYSMNIDADLSMKNLDADLTNPILYNGSCNAGPSDDVEHLYDEIKYKDECKDFGKQMELDKIETEHIFNLFSSFLPNSQRKSTITWTTLGQATHSSRTTIAWPTA